MHNIWVRFQAVSNDMKHMHKILTFVLSTNINLGKGHPQPSCVLTNTQTIEDTFFFLPDSAESIAIALTIFCSLELLVCKVEPPSFWLPKGFQQQEFPRLCLLLILFQWNFQGGGSNHHWLQSCCCCYHRFCHLRRSLSVRPTSSGFSFSAHLAHSRVSMLSPYYRLCQRHCCQTWIWSST